MDDSVNANVYITLQIRNMCIHAQKRSTITSLHSADTSNPIWNCYRTFQASVSDDQLMFQIWYKYDDVRDECLIGSSHIKMSETSVNVYNDDDDENYEDSLQALTIHLTNDHEKIHEIKLYFRLFVTDDSSEHQNHDEDERKQHDESSKHRDHGLIHTPHNNRIRWALLKNEYIENCRSLNQWSVNDISGRIINWIFDDLDYQSHLSRTQNLFSERKLDGDKLQHLSSDDVKYILKEEMCQFMTIDTLNIMCNGLKAIKPIMTVNHNEMRALWAVGSVVEVYSTKSSQWHEGDVMKIFTDEDGEWLEVRYTVENTTRVKQIARQDRAMIRTIKPNISCKDIARVLYNYPINQFVFEIHKQGLDGKRLLNLLKKETVCGWTQEEVEQIQQLLFKEMTLTTVQFARKMNKHTLHNHAQHILNEIMDTMDIEQVQYNIR
eukprot:222034_1